MITTVMAGVAVLVLGAAVWAAPLGTVTANLTGEWTDGTIYLYGVRQVEGYGGFYLLNKTAGTGQGTLIANGEVKSICSDLMQNSTSSSVVYDVVLVRDAPSPANPGLFGLARETALRELWGRHYATATTSQALAEAFSAAAWEIMYEDAGTWDVTSGTGFYCTGADTDQANAWLATLTLDGTGPMANLRALVSSDVQDYVVEVPEPATLGFLAVGGVIALLRRKR
jgi:hypothetical protein